MFIFGFPFLQKLIASIPRSSPEEQHQLSTAERLMIEKLPVLVDTLLNPKGLFAIITLNETVDPPLGEARLNAIDLLASLLSARNDVVRDQFIRYSIFKVVLDLFFKFQYNSLLHNSVVGLTLAAISSEDADLIQNV